MLINEGEAIYAKDGQATDTPGDGATLLVGQGGRIDEATAERHKITDRLRPASEVELTADFTGDPYVIVDGRAVAKSLLQDPNADAPPRRRDVQPAKAEAKSLHREAVEDKSLPGPAPKKDGHKAADKA